MNSDSTRHALYYPFHLCHKRTLQRMLNEYASIHFRDYMALQLTPMAGTTAYADRMGTYYPEQVHSGQIVQGYPVSGPLNPTVAAAVDQDLADKTWRSLFHTVLVEDRRFQSGLFDIAHGMLIGGTMVPGPAALLRLAESVRALQAYSVATVRSRSRKCEDLNDEYEYEYGMALVKTSASLAYTVELAIRHDLEAITDSAAHYQLLAHTLDRDHIDLRNHLVERHGY
ncbi:MAG: hypothetical protein ACREJU_12050 [Nitrospiraceae bacterium]